MLAAPGVTVGSLLLPPGRTQHDLAHAHGLPCLPVLDCFRAGVQTQGFYLTVCVQFALPTRVALVRLLAMQRVLQLLLSLLGEGGLEDGAAVLR